jgi:hypothetical protein
MGGSADLGDPPGRIRRTSRQSRADLCAGARSLYARFIAGSWPDRPMENWAESWSRGLAGISGFVAAQGLAAEDGAPPVGRAAVWGASSAGSSADLVFRERDRAEAGQIYLGISASGVDGGMPEDVRDCLEPDSATKKARLIGTAVVAHGGLVGLWASSRRGHSIQSRAARNSGSRWRSSIK